MRYGFVVPGGTAPELVDLAVRAEAAGWDGLFCWEGIYGVDPWVTLGAAAVRTERIRLGTMLTPVPRRRPWKVAAECVTLDQLSGGRAILAAGIGAVDTGLGDPGEPQDRKVRGALLDESLDIIFGLWSGKRVRYSGEHYRVDLRPGPRPIQRPRIPVWVVGAWPYPKSMRRVLRCDGLLPATPSGGGKHRPVTPPDVAAMAAYVAEHRKAKTPFDIVMEGRTPGGKRGAAVVGPWAESGCTWWLEAPWGASAQQVRDRLRRGPPR